MILGECPSESLRNMFGGLHAFSSNLGPESQQQRSSTWQGILRVWHSSNLDKIVANYLTICQDDTNIRVHNETGSLKSFPWMGAKWKRLLSSRDLWSFPEIKPGPSPLLPAN